MASLRDRVVAKAEGQLGVRYWTMHCGPRGSASEGFGCAMLCAWCLNQVLGTDFYGSCWNFWGDAIGAPQYNQGGGRFREVSASEAKAGDVVVYFNPNVNIGYSTSASHVALYVGDGMVIGAYGYGTPGTDYYMSGGSVRRTTVQYQSLGGAIRYIRCKALDSDLEEFPMSLSPTFSKPVYVRTSPSVKSMENVCKSGSDYLRYEKGDTVHLEGIVVAEERVWGYYTGATSHKRRYVSLGKTSNATLK